MSGVRVSSRDGGRGLKDAIRSLRESARPERIKAEMDAVLESACEGIRAAVPVRTGALKASGEWSSEVSDTEYVGTISFGGAFAPYAPYVIGRGVNGTFPWDEVLPAHAGEFERVLDMEFPD